MTPAPSQAKIHIERMMYRSSIAVTGDSAASYALIKLIPAGGGASKSLPLNLAVVRCPESSWNERVAASWPPRLPRRLSRLRQLEVVQHPDRPRLC